MGQTVTPAAGAGRQGIPWGWMGVALLAHTSWGAYPVLARYLQTISGLPSMAILCLGNAIGLLLLLPVAWRSLSPAALRSRALWLFALVVVVRAITNLLAARFTLAIYVQLVTLMTPFIVAVLSAGLFREKLPPYTVPALGLSLLGSVLIVAGDLGHTRPLTASDALGIGTALISAFALAFYMILVPRTVKGAVSGETVFAMQLVALTVSTGLISLILGEDWGRFGAIGPTDWVVFLTFALAVLFGANMGQISSLKRLGAPLVSSTMAWRLVSNLIMAALILGERLVTPAQLLGAALVLVTVSGYLWRQAHPGAVR